MNIDWAGFAERGLIHMQWAVLLYFLLVNGFYAVLLASATLEMRRHLLKIRGESRLRVLGSNAAPQITILAPAYNEAATIRESLRALLSLYYPNLKILVINDGSRDSTLEVLKAQFDLTPLHPIYRRQVQTREVRGVFCSRTHPNLIVVDKENGGKADALNVGLNFAAGELVCAIDSDTLIENDALQRMVRPFLERTDVVAAGGTIRVVNDVLTRGGRVVQPRAPRRPVPGFQAVEYLRAFLFGRLGWNRLGGNLIISGAFGLFRRDAVLRAGGYAHDTVGEDMELVLRLRRLGYETGGPHRVDFVPDPVAWTEVPETLAVLGRQRDRWHRGLADVLWRHRRLIFNPRYRAMGLVVVPYFILVELLAPVVEALGLISVIIGAGLGIVDWPFALLFFLVAYGLGTVLSFLTLLLDELSFRRYSDLPDRIRMLAWALFENVGYRQLTVIWRLRGLWKYLRGRNDWGSMERRGFSAIKPS